MLFNQLLHVLNAFEPELNEYEIEKVKIIKKYINKTIYNQELFNYIQMIQRKAKEKNRHSKENMQQLLSNLVYCITG